MRRNRRGISICFALLISMVCWFGQVFQASAHAELVTSNPVDGSSVEGPVSIVFLTFGEGVKHFNSMSIKDDSGHTYKVKNYDYNGEKVVVNLAAPIKSGKITMNWVALSEDGHNSPGELSFTVGSDSSAKSAQSSKAVQAPVQHNNTMITVALVILLIIILIGFVFLLKRNKK
ncbi:copper resistance protein CopC [Pullulanibacillus sp. KACC 23026]|uniref:copper resistance CopC family protein n=1 Tax=Pullulanibacillus sp. KACC 23026 TaxID=3028315 RepID=UPI0023AE83AC|nr:copper resistance protein CopC [Pullulanibacillus sp. KACC 23026]WEG12072.1 copper resistance protein CopC [Pullulanibacillus sp. KACC 23026]